MWRNCDDMIKQYSDWKLSNIGDSQVTDLELVKIKKFYEAIKKQSSVIKSEKRISKLLKQFGDCELID